MYTHTHTPCMETRVDVCAGMRACVTCVYLSCLACVAQRGACMRARGFLYVHMLVCERVCVAVWRLCVCLCVCARVCVHASIRTYLKHFMCQYSGHRINTWVPRRGQSRVIPIRRIAFVCHYSACGWVCACKAPTGVLGNECKLYE